MARCHTIFAPTFFWKSTENTAGSVLPRCVAMFGMTVAILYLYVWCSRSCVFGRVCLSRDAMIGTGCFSGIACETMVQNAHVSPSTDAALTPEDAIVQCRYCRYFREEPWETGYCRHTHMFVLETFSCDKFIRAAVADESRCSENRMTA